MGDTELHVLVADQEFSMKIWTSSTLCFMFYVLIDVIRKLEFHCGSKVYDFEIEFGSK